MSYKTRNIITLAVLLILILGISGYWILVSYPNESEVAYSLIDKSKKLVAQREEIKEQLKIVQNQIDENELKLSSLDKQIVSDITSAESYEYFNEILRKVGSLEFNLRYSGNRDAANYGYHIYKLSGEGGFREIHQFIHYLEKGPKLYKVRSVTLRGVESSGARTSSGDMVLPFDLEVWAYYASVENIPLIQRTLADVPSARIGDPFRPLIKRRLPPNTRGLLEVERGELKAIVPGKALIADYKGNIVALKEGDEVYLGYLTRIQPDQGTVEFSLNKGGVARSFTLRIDFDD